MWDNGMFSKIQLTCGTNKSATKRSTNDAPKSEHKTDAADRTKIKSDGQKICVREPIVSHRKRIATTIKRIYSNAPFFVGAALY